MFLPGSMSHVRLSKEKEMKKFYRSRLNRRLAGICGGLGHYTDTDPVLWRILMIILFFTTVPAFFIYIIVALITNTDENI